MANWHNDEVSKMIIKGENDEEEFKEIRSGAGVSYVADIVDEHHRSGGSFKTRWAVGQQYCNQPCRTLME